MTLRSVEMFWEYEPGAYLPYISPTPLLMVVAAGDHLTVSDLAIDAFERAREPKRLEILTGGHFDAYIAGLRAAPAARRATGSSRTCWHARARAGLGGDQAGRVPFGAARHVARHGRPCGPAGPISGEVGGDRACRDRGW